MRRVLMNIHATLHDLSTRRWWHEYSWAHVAGGMNIHEDTSRVTWIFIRTRRRWHEFSWAHVTADMNIHDHTSRVMIIHVTCDVSSWIFMSPCMCTHEFSCYLWRILVYRIFMLTVIYTHEYSCSLWRVSWIFKLPWRVSCNNEYSNYRDVYSRILHVT